MLKFLSRRNRSRNALLIIFIAALTIGLIGFFAPGLRPWASGGAAADDDSVVATVLKRDITVKELRSALNAYGQQMAQGQGASKQMDLETVYSLYGQQAIDNLIRKEIILYEAEQNNLLATDGEVQEKLKQVFNPWPGPEQYRARLQQAGTTPIEFEENLRASIAEEKLRAFISAAAQVSPQEIEDDYRKANTTYKVRWMEVTPDKFRSQVVVNDANLRAYFDAHKADFKITQEERKAKYIFIDQKKAGEAVQVSDDELKKAFNPAANIQQVRVSQIVINVPQKAGEAKPKSTKPKELAGAADATPGSGEDQELAKKVEDIFNRAKGKDGKAPEDFAALAREFSQDAKSKAAGGDIGYLNKKDKRDSDDPLNRVFSMAKDEVSSPIRKGDKFYILKVTDRKTPTFDEARPDLLKEVRNQKSYSKAVEVAQEAAQKFKESKNAEAVVAEINSKYGAQVAVVKETPFFVKGENLPELGAASDLETALFALPNPGEVSNWVNANNGFAVVQFSDTRDPHDPTFEEVKARVEQRYREDKAKDIAAEQARKIAQAQTPDAMKAAGDALGLRVEERAGLSASDSIGPLVSEANREPIYKLKAGEVLREPVKITDSDNYVVAAVIERRDADMGEAFQKAKKGIEDKLLQEKQEALFMAHLTTVEKQLKDAGKIKIRQEVIDTLLASSPTKIDPSNPMGTPNSTRPRRRAPQGQPRQ
ncbi:MAG: peptidyl-prolyl cis-trans isomerase [Acidobacteria bacterium]|nr:peptidyl-prolyl cis-trans isomerase [Acidobacteriota bacterium]